MHYLISVNMKDEILARKKYIYDSVQLWTRIFPAEEGFISFESIPTQVLSIFFIVGHNYLIENFLKSHFSSIEEETIVAITCDGNTNFASIKTPGKALYIPHQNKNNYAELLKGEKYGFDFDITESEIIFYNSRKSKDIKKRINQAFTRLH